MHLTPIWPAGSPGSRTPEGAGDFAPRARYTNPKPRLFGFLHSVDGLSAATLPLIALSSCISVRRWRITSWRFHRGKPQRHSGSGSSPLLEGSEAAGAANGVAAEAFSGSFLIAKFISPPVCPTSRLLDKLVSNVGRFLQLSAPGASTIQTEELLECVRPAMPRR